MGNEDDEMLTKTKATIDDLYQVPDNQKAELVNGALVLLMPTGDAPGYAADEIFASLREYAKKTRTDRSAHRKRLWSPG